MKKLGIFILTLIGVFFIETKESFASHASGMDLFYRHTLDSTYEFTFIFYRNCQGSTAGPPNPATIYASAPSINRSPLGFTCAMLPITGPNVPPLNPPNMLNCTDATTLCYEEYVYRGTWTSPQRARDWTFTFNVCCRPVTNAPTNITANTQWIQCGLNNFDFPDWKNKNWSPFWHNRRPNHPGHTTDTVINYLPGILCRTCQVGRSCPCKAYGKDS
ncbi:MAG TPA: hypothetical protein DCX54_06235 [Flavobacteriales bacterium]|nr:hypothetical protein [Flavobacteriales bacterium]